ncbi:hypothetical protein BREVNS_1963 [Brevinematales bacterium NS]|nr:hypothetical protein BREVNS_1963 [Brevinematales bacterium NS]
MNTSKPNFKHTSTQCAYKQTEIGMIPDEWEEERTKGERISAFVSRKIQNTRYQLGRNL